MDYPYWVEDENFELENHVRHIALPKPGDWRQFCIQVSRLHARALDMSQPLWEIYVIEGLDGVVGLPKGCFAVLIKTHLAAVTVKQAGELTRLLHDVTVNPAAETPPPPWFPESPTSKLSLALRGGIKAMGSPLRLAAPIWRSVAKVTPAVISLAGERLLRRSSATITRFNSVVSPHRVFESRRFEQAEFDEIRTLVGGATVNDAVIAVCGGALRRYLHAQAELPETSLWAMARRSMPDAGAAGPTVHAKSWLPVRLGTELADPVLRLSLIREQTHPADDLTQAACAGTLSGLTERAAAGALAFMHKMVGHATLIPGQHASMTNCTITPVPVPAGPLYLCGARMTYSSAILPIADGMGLVFAVTLHDSHFVISLTSCRELMPDPEMFGKAIRDSFQEYLAIARRTLGPAHTGSAKRRSRRAARPRRTATPPPRDKPPTSARPVPSSAGKPRRSAPSG